MPSHLADLTSMPWKVCVASCLQTPGQGKFMGGSRRFSRGKPLQAAFWEASQAQIYICGPKSKIKGNSKCCKSSICRVSTLHFILYVGKGLTAWKFVFLFPWQNSIAYNYKTSSPSALDHMVMLVLLGSRTSSHGIQHSRQLWEESFPQERRHFSTQPQSCEQDGLAMPQIIDSEWAKALGKLRKLLSLHIRGVWSQKCKKNLACLEKMAFISHSFDAPIPKF